MKGGKQIDELRARILEAAHITEREQTYLWNLKQRWSQLKLSEQEGDLQIGDLQQEPFLNKIPESYECGIAGQFRVQR